MGTGTYGKLIQTAVSRLGMDRSGKNTSNQSLRTTTFNAQVIIFFNFTTVFYMCVCRTWSVSLMLRKEEFLATSARRLQIFTLGTFSALNEAFFLHFWSRQLVEDMARMSALMQAAISGIYCPPNLICQIQIYFSQEARLSHSSQSSTVCFWWQER